MLGIEDGVADFGVADGLDVSEHETDLARGKFLAGCCLGRLVAEAFDLKLLAVRPKADLLSQPDAAVEYAHQDDDAAVAVEPGVEDQGAQRRIDVALGGRHQVDDGFEDLVDACPLFGAGQHGARGVQADHGLDLLANAIGLGRGEIDLVDDRNDFEIVVQCKVGIGEGLGFYALAGVHYQQRALAGLQAARDFVRKIDVAGRIDQVELVEITVIGSVIEADGVGFDGDAALTLQVHRVENLLHHFTLGEGASDFEEPVGEGRLTVVDVRNDREIADEIAVHAVWGKALKLDYPTGGLKAAKQVVDGDGEAGE